MNLYVIRHGKTDWNLQSRMQGQSNIQLNQIGINQANEIRELIRGFSVFAVLVYMVDKDRFLNWIKMQRYIWREKRLKPEISQPQVDIE